MKLLLTMNDSFLLPHQIVAKYIFKIMKSKQFCFIPLTKTAENVQVKHAGSNSTWEEHVQLQSALCGTLTAESVSCQSHSGAERSRLQEKNKWAPGGRLLPDYITEDDLMQGHSVMSCTLNGYSYLRIPSFLIAQLVLVLTSPSLTRQELSC